MVVYLIRSFPATRHSNKEDVEALIGNIPGDKRLVFIEGADDNLCVPMSKQVEYGLTQSMLDQIVLDEIGNFLISIAGKRPCGPIYIFTLFDPLSRRV